MRREPPAGLKDYLMLRPGEERASRGPLARGLELADSRLLVQLLPCTRSKHVRPDHHTACQLAHTPRCALLPSTAALQCIMW